MTYDASESLPESALDFFTDRENFADAFERYLKSDDIPLKVLVFWGVGGIGKTSLIKELWKKLETSYPAIPYAYFDFESAKETVNTYREALLSLRIELGSKFRIKFPRFDLCLSLMLAKEGGDPPALVRENPTLYKFFKFSIGLGVVPLASPAMSAGEFIINKATKASPEVEKWVRRAGGTEEVIDIRRRVQNHAPGLPEELIRRFVEDLKAGFKKRRDRACQGIIFLDSYESLWKVFEGDRSAHARKLDKWVREFAKFCLESNILLVIGSRDRIRWGETNSRWSDDLDQHLLGGLSAHDAQSFLHKCSIGPGISTSEVRSAKSFISNSASPLQRAIIEVCNENRSKPISEFQGEIPEIQCHTQLLALCAKIVLNTRRSKGDDPPTSLFANIPQGDEAADLADHFLESLHNRSMEMWIEELSLTPRFDEMAALAWDKERGHGVGPAGWELLKGLSFVTEEDGGFWRLHRTMRDVLRLRFQDDADRIDKVHGFFQTYWEERHVDSLSWFHKWSLQPHSAVSEWGHEHDAAIKGANIAKARNLLNMWSEITLDEEDRRRIGDKDWAWSHRLFGVALAGTPFSGRVAALAAAIEHHRMALKVYDAMIEQTSDQFIIEEWIRTHLDLAYVYVEMPQEGLGQNLTLAIKHCQTALTRCPRERFRWGWAMIHNNMGNAYCDLTVGDEEENKEKAIALYKKALEVRTEEEVPLEWALMQHNLGYGHVLRIRGSSEENLEVAIQHFQNALRYRTEENLPHYWAMTQDTAGTAYLLLARIRDHKSNIQKAMTCHQGAARVYTEDKFPEEWATAQCNLGTVYRELPSNDLKSDLETSIGYFHNARRVFTEADYPAQTGTLNFELGLTYEKYMEVSPDAREKACQCLLEAERLFTLMWMPTQAAEAHEALIRVQNEDESS